MSKFNRLVKNASTEKTVNLEGGEAFKLDTRTELYTVASTSLGGGAGDKFYRSATAEYTQLVALIDKVAKTDPAFIFQLAAYLRKEMYLRSIPTILFIEGVRAMHRNKPQNTKEYAVNAVQFAKSIFGRPDEITEALAYWKFVTNDQNTLPSPIRKSLQVALNSFNEYSMIKYDQDSKEVKFRDVLRRVHPEPKSPAQAALFNYLIREVLDEDLLPQTAAREKLLKLKEFDEEARHLIRLSNATWETVVSKFGSKPEVWNFIIPNMGYMAVLRNLNNFLKHNVDIAPVIDILTSPEEVRKSKQLPFRFLSAYKAIGEEYSTKATKIGYSYYNRNDAMFYKWTSGNSTSQTEQLKTALGKALNLSIVNLPKFPGRTLCSADVSGSMDKVLNDKSTVTMKEIACVFTAMANELSEDGIITSFGTNFEVLQPSVNVLATAKALSDSVTRVGMGTEPWKILDYLIQRKIVVDRVLIFSDTQCYNTGGYGSYNYGGSSKTLNGLWKQYREWVKNETGKSPVLYEVNLAGYGTSSFDRSSGVAIVAGWSDKIFNLMASFEEDPRSSVKKIKEKYPVNETVKV